MSEATTYVVLKRDTPAGEEAWYVVNRIPARSADVAIQSVVEQSASDVEDGIYVAVPARSWNPREVQVQIETKVVFGGDAA